MKPLIKLSLLLFVAVSICSCMGSKYTVFGDSYPMNKYERTGYGESPTSTFKVKNTSEEICFLSFTQNVGTADEINSTIECPPGKTTIKGVPAGMTFVELLGADIEGNYYVVDSLNYDIPPCHKHKQKLRGCPEKLIPPNSETIGLADPGPEILLFIEDPEPLQIGESPHIITAEFYPLNYSWFR